MNPQKQIKLIKTYHKQTIFIVIVGVGENKSLASIFLWKEELTCKQKVISTIISVVIMLCLSLTAFAEPELQTPSDDDISVCYLYTDKISGTLSISNKAATCKSTVRGISGTTTKIVITQTLQKKK